MLFQRTGVTEQLWLNDIESILDTNINVSEDFTVNYVTFFQNSHNNLNELLETYKYLDLLKTENLLELNYGIDVLTFLSVTTKISSDFILLMFFSVEEMKPFTINEQTIEFNRVQINGCFGPSCLKKYNWANYIITSENDVFHKYYAHLDLYYKGELLPQYLFDTIWTQIEIFVREFQYVLPEQDRMFFEESLSVNDPYLNEVNRKTMRVKPTRKYKDVVDERRLEDLNQLIAKDTRRILSTYWVYKNLWYNKLFKDFMKFDFNIMNDERRLDIKLKTLDLSDNKWGQWGFTNEKNLMILRKNLEIFGYKMKDVEEFRYSIIEKIINLNERLFKDEECICNYSM